MGNEIKMVCFDMDDTLISQNSWYKLNLALGVTSQEDKEMYDAYGAGKLSYEDWMRVLVDLYKKRGLANEANIKKALTHYELTDGAKDLVLYLKEKGYNLALISGSFDVLVENVAEKLNIPFFKGNTRFVFSENGNLEDIKSEGDETLSKVRHLEAFCNSLKMKITECACIGDGANDVELFRKSEHGITFEDSTDYVKKDAWKVVKNLLEIKEIL